jgi:predicted outer membrane protein
MGGARFAVRWAPGAAVLVCAQVTLVALAGCSSGSPAAGASPASLDAAASDAPDAQDPSPAMDASAEASTAGDAAGAAVCSSAPLLPVCSDGQILAILAAEQAAHVDLAEAVRAGLSSSGALDLAEKLLTDDSVLAVEVDGEARETGIAPAPGGVDREIATEAQGAIQALAGESSPRLDSSYVDREVLAHLRALALIDRMLGPSVHDPRIGDLLARVRNLVVQHAQAASQAQSELEGPCASNAE